MENRTRRNDKGLDREGPDADPAMDLHSPAERDAKIMPRLSSKRRIRIDSRWERSDQDVQDDRLGATTMLRLLHVLYGPRARSGAGEPSGLLSLAPTRIGGRRYICGQYLEAARGAQPDGGNRPYQAQL